MTGPDDNLPGAPLPQPPLGFWPTVRRDLRLGVIAGLQTFWDLAKVMIPAYGVTLALRAARRHRLAGRTSRGR